MRPGPQDEKRRVVTDGKTLDLDIFMNRQPVLVHRMVGITARDGPGRGGAADGETANRPLGQYEAKWSTVE